MLLFALVALRAIDRFHRERPGKLLRPAERYKLRRAQHEGKFQLRKVQRDGKPLTGRELQSIQCDICTKIVDFVEQKILEGVGKDAIIQLLNGLCNELPAPLNTVCQSLVDGIIDQVFDLIDQGLKGLDICKKLHLCT